MILGVNNDDTLVLRLHLAIFLLYFQFSFCGSIIHGNNIFLRHSSRSMVYTALKLHPVQDFSFENMGENQIA